MMLLGIFLVNILSVFGTSLGEKKICNQVYNIMIQKRRGLFSSCASGLCICNANEAVCSRHHHRNKLHYIPQLPDTITSLIFSGNYLPHINETTFKNVSAIKELHLFNNQVKNITRNAFEYLTALTTLSLSDPGLQVIEVSTAFSSLDNSKIMVLCLDQKGWNNLPSDFFHELFTSNIQIVYLSSQIHEIDISMFSGLKHLNILDLKNNKLKSFVMRGRVISSIKVLDINRNLLTSVPVFCNSLAESYLPKLEELNLSDNKISQLTKGDFICLEKVKTLFVEGNPISVLGNNFMSSLYSLKSLHLTNIDRDGWTSIGNYALNSSTLESLHFGGNSLNSDYYDPEYLFSNCPTLVELYLMNAQLLTVDDVHLLLSPLLRIKVHILDLSYIDLPYIPEVISNMTSLRVLYLGNNKIRSWNGTNIFGKLELLALDLSGNQISVLNETSFPASLLNSLDKNELGLYGNPYSCTCQTLKSIQWLRRHAYLLDMLYPWSYICFSPAHFNGMSIKDYNPSAESCAEKNIALLVSVPVSIVTVTVITAIYLVYKCRWRLRYGVYRFNNRYKKYERIDGQNDFVYAGFVIYSDDDRYWVHNDLINKMENQEGFRLCIRHRDFDVGKVHVENIVENMFLSEKIIVILSNNFAKDDWCHFQLLLAETRLLKQSTDMLVILMLNEIHSDSLRASLYKLVTEEQYALWSNDQTGNTLFWEQAVSQMKRSTVIN